MAGLVDEQLRDPYNFGLGERPISVIDSLCIGFATLLLTDLSFRVVVRIRSGEVNPYSIYRRTLLLRFSNPLEWLSSIKPHETTQTQQGLPTKQPGKKQKEADQKHFPTWGIVGIACVGVSLMFLQFLFIFLATNKLIDVDFDATQLPAMHVDDPGDDSLLFHDYEYCKAEPLTSKKGFISQANVMLCNIVRGNIPRPWASNSTLNAIFVRHETHIELLVLSPGNIADTFVHYLDVELNNGPAYTISLDSTQEEVRRTMPFGIRRQGMEIVNTSSYLVEIENYGTSWEERFEIDSSSVTVPKAVESRFSENLGSFRNLREEDIPRFRRAYYIASVMRSSISLTGRRRAFGMSPAGPFLDELDFVLVKQQRPRFSIVGIISLCCGILLMWIVVLYVFKWHAGVDERKAWTDLFVSVKQVEDFKRVPNETLEMRYVLEGN